MTLADWFTPRRRRAETSRTASLAPPFAASEPVKVPEPRRSPTDATGPLRAPRGREFWLVANGRGDVWDFDDKHAAESWAHGRAAVDGELVVWATQSEESA